MKPCFAKLDFHYVSNFNAHEMFIELEILAQPFVLSAGLSTFNKFPGNTNAAGPQVTLWGAQLSSAYETHN